MRYFILFLIGCFISSAGNAQVLSLDSAVCQALKNNPAMKVASLETSRQRALTRGSVEIPKTDVSLMYGQYNSIVKNDNNISIAQTIPFPSVWARQKKLSRELLLSSTLIENVTANSLTYEVAKIFNHLLYLKAEQKILSEQDSIMRDMARIIAFQFKAGESTLLAKSLADTRLLELENQQKRNDVDIQIYLEKLRFICRADLADVTGEFDEIVPIGKFDSDAIKQNPLLALTAQDVTIAHEKKRLEAARMMPDIRIGYFTQTLIGSQNIGGTDQYFGSDKRFHGFQLGLSIPLWFAPFNSRIKSATISEAIAKEQHEAQSLALQQQSNEIQQKLIKNINSLLWFKTSGLKSSRLLRHQSEIAFKNGEIDYQLHLLNLQQTLAVEQNFLTTQYEYNQNIITINYLRGGNQK